MNANRLGKKLGAGAVLLAFGLLLGACATEVVHPPRAIEQKVATAKTRADHEGLAGWYEQEAKAAKEKAKQHRRMAVGYGSWGGGGRSSGAGMQSHCQNLVRQYEQASEDNLALAKLHRQMAAEANE